MGTGVAVAHEVERVVHGYPKKLTSFGLPRGVRKIDAALYDVESGKTLFFVDNYYFRCV